MNRKAVAITVVVLATLSLLMWLRGNQYGTDIRTILPFLDGQEVSVYQWGRLALIVMGAWGLWRLYRRSQPSDGEETTNEDMPAEEPSPEPDDVDRGDSDQHPN